MQYVVRPPEALLSIHGNAHQFSTKIASNSINRCAALSILIAADQCPVGDLSCSSDMQGSGDDEAVLLRGRLGSRHTQGTTHGLHVPQLRSGGSCGGSSGVDGRGHTQRTQCSFSNKQGCADHAGQYENNESVLSEKLTTVASSSLLKCQRVRMIYAGKIVRIFIVLRITAVLKAAASPRVRLICRGRSAASTLR